MSGKPHLLERWLSTAFPHPCPRGERKDGSGAFPPLRHHAVPGLGEPRLTSRCLAENEIVRPLAEHDKAWLKC